MSSVNKVIIIGRVGKDPEKDIIQENMQRFGGSFVQALGVALTKADSFNTARIKNAFPDYWEEYLNFKAA